MKLVEFSVENYRSITAANKIKLKNIQYSLGKIMKGNPIYYLHCMFQFWQ